jgi:hypothetical protein
MPKKGCSNPPHVGLPDEASGESSPVRRPRGRRTTSIFSGHPRRETTVSWTSKTRRCNVPSAEPISCIRRPINSGTPRADTPTNREDAAPVAKNAAPAAMIGGTGRPVAKVGAAAHGRCTRLLARLAGKPLRFPSSLVETSRFTVATVSNSSKNAKSKITPHIDDLPSRDT